MAEHDLGSSTKRRHAQQPQYVSNGLQSMTASAAFGLNEQTVPRSEER